MLPLCCMGLSQDNLLPAFTAALEFFNFEI